MDEQHSNGLKRIFEEHFGTLPSRVVVSRAPGRIELAGNHTDHQGGRVVSAAISYCVSVLAARKSAPLIDVYMEGFGRASIDLLDPLWYEPKQSERNTSAALVRGMAAQLKDAGATIAGCNLVVCSAIPVGSGLSSSAAFEMAIGAAFHELFLRRRRLVARLHSFRRGWGGRRTRFLW